MIALLLNHLWQSSIVVGGAGLLTLALHRNSASARFWLWFAASVKFLVPFAALTALGTWFLTPIVPPVAAPTVMLMAPWAVPFSASAPVLTAPAPAAARLDITSIFLGLWLAGLAIIAMRWLVRWSRVRALLHKAAQMQIDAPIAVKFSASRLEPGLVGILRPVILLPQGIEQQLSPAELNAVLAHELRHWRRHDNLLAAVHMLVEALFWFFPLVWWLGARLNAERERACDESVLASGNDPQMYAEGILKVCRIYLQSPLACIAGVSGAGLKKRMETIMENRLILRLNAVRKLMLSASAAAALVLPLAFGLAVAPVAQMPAQAEPAPSPTLNAQRRAEQALPRKPVPFNPAHFDKYVGYYQMNPSTILTVSRNAGHFFLRVTGQVNVEMFPESETKFFSTQVAAQISFNSDAQGQVTSLVLHQNGQERPAVRIVESTAKSVEEALIERIRMNKPSPGTEAALRHQIETMIKGQRDYSVLAPTLASTTKEMEPMILASLSSLGPLKSIKFRSVNPGGMDTYDVAFERGSSEWFITPLAADGKINGMFWRRVP